MRRLAREKGSSYRVIQLAAARALSLVRACSYLGERDEAPTAPEHLGRGVYVSLFIFPIPLSLSLSPILFDTF